MISAVASENEKVLMGPKGKNVSGGADLYVGGVRCCRIYLRTFLA